MIKLRKLLLSNRFFFFILLFTIIITIFRYSFPKKSIISISDDSISGVITSIKYNGNVMTFNLNIKNKENVSCYYYFKKNDELNEMKKNINLGYSVKLVGEVLVVKDSSVDNTFSYRNYLKIKNIHYLFKANNIIVKSDKVNFFYKIKNFILSYLSYFKSGPYIKMLLLGDMNFVSGKVIDSFRKNGISHLFAISGTQVTVLADAVIKLLKKFKIKEKNRYIIVNIFITFYMFLTGSPPAILRAVLFFLLSSINKYNYFYISNLNLFLLTLSITLLINPYYIYDLGFLYSYVISMSLIMCSDILENKKYFVSLFLTSLISFLVSLPITLYNFYEINFMSIIYNLFYVPFVNTILFPLSLISLLFYPLDYVLNFFIIILEKTSLYISNINFGRIVIPKLNLFYYVFYYLLLYFFYKYKKKVFVLLFILMFIFHYNFYIFFDFDYIYMFDVGQGDSILIHSNNTNMLIDTGGKLKHYSESWMKKDNESSIAENSLIPFFKSMGIRKLQFLELSHGDYDHLGEALKIIDNFKVEKVFINEGYINNNEKRIINRIDSNVLYEGSSFSVGNFNFISLNTDLNDENDSSTILYGECGDIKLLFMGDASVRSEEYVLNNYDIGKIDILKVGHHGSNTSSSKKFIKTINPTYSLISVGEKNKFGHPNKEVLENLNNSKIYRTDEDGSIMFKIKNNKLKIETCSP